MVTVIPWPANVESWACYRLHCVHAVAGAVKKTRSSQISICWMMPSSSILATYKLLMVWALAVSSECSVSKYISNLTATSELSKPVTKKEKDHNFKLLPDSPNVSYPLCAFIPNHETPIFCPAIWLHDHWVLSFTGGGSWLTRFASCRETLGSNGHHKWHHKYLAF